MAVRLPPNPTDENQFIDIANGHGYPVIIKGAWEGKETCRTIANALDAWCKAEEAHSNALKKISNTYALPELTETGSTLNTSWQALKLGMLHHSRTVETFAKSLREHEKKYVDFRHKQSKVKRSLEAETKAANKSLSDSTSTKNSLEKKYKSACKTAETTIKKRNSAKSDPKAKPESVHKLGAKVAKHMKEVEKCDLNYQAQVDTLNLEEISHRKKMDSVLMDLQIVEETRIANTKEILTEITTDAMKVFETTMNGWGGVTEGVSAIAVKTDIKRFVMRQCSEAKAKGQALPRIPRTPYLPYVSQTLDDEGRSSTRNVDEEQERAEQRDSLSAMSRETKTDSAESNDVSRSFSNMSIATRRTTPMMPPPANARTPPPHPRTSSGSITATAAPTTLPPPQTNSSLQPEVPPLPEAETKTEIPKPPTKKASSLDLHISKGGPPGMHDDDPPGMSASSSGPPGMQAEPAKASKPARPSNKAPSETNEIW